MSIRFLPAVGCCLALGLLAGCAAQPAVQPSAQQKIPLQTFPQNMAIQQGNPADESKLTNDPSAPANTPLCGVAARESQAMAAQNYPEPLTSGNSCVQNACFNTQSGTYIAADGTQRVCR
ncbi:hypothetical protein [Acetobacter orleanensis]|nr:hypothetical protein [Acetobacter orleanensis]PCD79382.1 hypothetical protein CO710_06945 [Acetobacter orleanensis]